MSNRFFVEGCLLGGCFLASVMEGPLPLLVGIIGVITVEVAIAKMKKNDFIGKLDHRADKLRQTRR